MFKQVRFTIMALIAILAMGVNQAFANGTLVEGLYYIFDEGTKTATVTYTGPSAPGAAGDNSYTGAIEVPGQVYYDGYLYNVTKIGDNAFRYSTVTSLTLNEGLLSLGTSSLNNMTEIEELVFPNSMTSNGNGDPLCGCTKLKSISFGTGFTTHGQGTCYSGSPVTDVYFNSTTPPTSRGAYFLTGCQGATIHVPDIAVAAYQTAYPTFGPNIIGDIAVVLTWEDFQAAIQAYKNKGYKSGTTPNVFPAGTTADYDAAIAAAEALTESAPGEEMRAALAAIVTAANGLASAIPNALTEGYYYIRNNYEAYNTKFGAYPAMFTAPEQPCASGAGSVRYEKFDAANPNFIYKLTAKAGKDEYFYAQNVVTGWYLNTGDGDSWYNEYTNCTEDAQNAQWFRPYGAGTGEFWISDETDYRVSRSIASASQINEQGSIFGWTVFTDDITAALKGYNSWTLIPVTEAQVNAIKVSYKEAEEAKAAAKEEALALVGEYQAMAEALQGGKAPYDKVTTETAEAFANAYATLESVVGSETMSLEECVNAINAFKAATQAVESALPFYYIVNACPDFINNTGVEKAICVEEGNKTLRWGTFNKIDKKQIFEIKPLANGNYIIKNYGTGAYLTSSTENDYSKPVFVSENEADAVEQVISLYENDYAGAYAIHNTFCDIDYHPESNHSGKGNQGNIVTYRASWANTSQWYLYKVEKADWAAIEQAELGEGVKAYIEEATTKASKVANMTITDEAIIASDASNLTTNCPSLSLEKLVDGDLSKHTETWSMYPHNDAYLQVDITGKELNLFYITIAPRADDGYKNDTPLKWIITGSNDGENWDYIDQRTTNGDELAIGEAYTYEPVILTSAYKYLRFTSPVAIKNRTGYTSHFALAEFQLYYGTFDNPDEELEAAIAKLGQDIVQALNDINNGALTAESAPAFQNAIAKFDAEVEEYNNPTIGGVWEFANEATAPAAGKTYVVKNVNKANYFTSNGVEKQVSPFNADGVWTLEATGEQEDGLNTYYLKSIGKGLYVKKENWANYPDGYDGYDVHEYAGFNADLTDNTAEAIKVTVAACGSTSDWRSADGGETGYIIATAYDGKQLRLGQQGGTDVTFEPYTEELAWQFYEATYNNDINAELAAAIEVYNIDVANAKIGSSPGFYNTEKVAAYTAVLDAAKALTTESPKADVRKAIDDLKAAYEVACEVNPMVDGFYYFVNATPLFDQNAGVKKAMCTNEGSTNLGWETLNKTNKNQVFEVKSLTNGNFIIKNYGTGAYITSSEKADRSQPVFVTTNEAEAVEQRIYLYENDHAGAFAINNTFCDIDYHPEGNSTGNGVCGNIVTWKASWSDASQWYIYKVEEADWKALEQADLGESVKALVEETTAKMCKAANVAITDEAIIASDASNLSSNAPSLALAKLVNGNLSETTETWSQYPQTDAYLQVDITGKDVHTFYLTIATRTGVEYKNDTPVKWIITGSTDGENWEYIDQRTTNGDDLAVGQLYTYEPVSFRPDYNYLRFTSPVAIKNRTGKKSHFALGEFQLYKAEVGTVDAELTPAFTEFATAVAGAISGINDGTLTEESAHTLQASIEMFDAALEEYNRPAGVWEYADAATAPEAGKTYAIKNVAQSNYLTTNGVEATVSPLNAEGVWTLEATGEQEDGLNTYYLKSVGKGLYIKKEDWANAEEGFDGFDIHGYCGLNADLTDNTAEAVKVTVAACGSTADWRSADGGETGYIIATAYDEKQLRLGQQRGTDATFEPYTDNLAWQFHEATFNNDLGAELAAAIETYDFDAANAQTGEYPGYYNAEKIAAYTTALNDAKALTGESTKTQVHEAIDNLKAAFEAASEVNPIVEGYYYIASAGKGSGHPASDEVKYDEEERFALYNEGGFVNWKMFDESLYDEIYYFSPAADGTWYVKSLCDATYMKRGTGAYNCKITTSTEPEVSQLFEHSVVVGKWIARFKDNPYAYALTASHNGSKGEQTGTLNIWGTPGEANSCKMNLWYVIPVSEETVTAAKESLSAGLDALIAQIEAENLQGSDKPGYYSQANIEALNAALEAGKTASDADAKYTAVNNIKEVYNKAITEFNPITDGYYYLVNKNQTYATNFGAPAAMYTAPKDLRESGLANVRFDKFDENNPNFIFKLTAKGESTENYYAQNAYTNYYLNTGDGDSWYGEITTCTPEAVNAQVFMPYGLGQYWVADETDTRVSRVIRPALQNGTVYGWTQIGDNVTGDNVGYNAWELIPVAEEKVQELVANKQVADEAATAALALLTVDVITSTDAINGYLAEGSDVAEDDKAALQAAFDAATAAIANRFYDITSTADDYAALQQALDAAIEAAGETEVIRDYWQIAEEPSTPEPGKFYVLKNAYNGKFLDATDGTAAKVDVLSDIQVWGLSEIEKAGETNKTYALYSVGKESYFQYVNYASQQWDENTPYDGYDWFGYAGMNATFGDAETAQEFTVLPAVAGNDDIPNSTGKSEAKGYVLAAFEKIELGTSSSYFKLGVQGTDAALEPWNEDVAWEFYEATPVEDALKAAQIAFENYGNLKMIGGTAPGFYSASSVAAYDMAKEATENAINEPADAETLRNAANALIEAAENCDINPIVEGYYFIVTAGHGSGYPFSEEVVIDREEQAALFNDGGVVKWGPYDDTATKYVYHITVATSGEYVQSADDPDNETWCVKNIADDSYMGTCKGSYAQDVTTTDGFVNAQEFIWLKEGKWAMKSTACNYMYAMNASHNGSDDAMGNLSVWGTAAEALKYGINQWFLIPCSEEMIDKVTAVGGITADDAVANGDIFTIDGKKVDKTVKGQIYIQNGKKVKF